MMFDMTLLWIHTPCAHVDTVQHQRRPSQYLKNWPLRLEDSWQRPCFSFPPNMHLRTVFKSKNCPNNHPRFALNTPVHLCHCCFRFKSAGYKEAPTALFIKKIRKTQLHLNVQGVFRCHFVGSFPRLLKHLLHGTLTLFILSNLFAPGHSNGYFRKQI